MLEVKKMKRRGMTLMEMVVYTAILSTVLLVLVQSLVTIAKTHRGVMQKQVLESSAALTMERILREIRNASSINIPASTLGSSPGVLSLAGIDEDSLSYTITFDSSGGAVRINKNGGTPGALSAQGVTATTLIFRHLANTNSDAVRVELSLSGPVGNEARVIDLYGFAVLRNSY